MTQSVSQVSEVFNRAWQEAARRNPMLLALNTSPALLQAASRQIEAAQARNTPDYEIHQALVDFFLRQSSPDPAPPTTG